MIQFVKFNYIAFKIINIIKNDIDREMHNYNLHINLEEKLENQKYF